MSGRLEYLLRKDRVYLVEVDGFDEFTADLHMAAGLDLPKPIARPFDMARDRARLFVEIDDTLKSHPVIGSHVREVLGSMNSHRPTMPLPVEGAILSSMGEFTKAIPIWQQANKEDPTDEFIANQFAETLADAGRDDDLVEFVREAPISVSRRIYFLLRAGRNQEVIDQATVALTEPTAIKFNRAINLAIVRINRAIALKRLGLKDEMLADLDFLDQNGDTRESAIRAGVAALRGEREEMLSALKRALNRTISREQLEVFPVFEDYWADPDFQDLAREANGD